MNARPETVPWLERYYRLVDSGRIRELMSEYMAEDWRFRVGKAESVGFIEEARRMAGLVKGLRHEIVTVLEGDDGMLGCELNVTYIRHDGTSVTLPGSLFARVAGGHAGEQRAYVDQGPLLA